MSYIIRWYGLPSNYDDWKTTPPEPEEITVAYCEECGSDIFAGDEIYKTSEGLVHDECFLDFAKNQLDAVWDIAEKPEPPEPDYFDDWE